MTNLAKEKYCEAWLKYRDNPTEKLAKELDYWQTKICSGPCQEWNDFIITLPGYIEFWNNFRSKAEIQLKDLYINKN